MDRQKERRPWQRFACVFLKSLGQTSSLNHGEGGAVIMLEPRLYWSSRISRSRQKLDVGGMPGSWFLFRLKALVDQYQLESLCQQSG